MKENEYMDIAEFSKIVGVTKQAVYTSKRLKPYLKKIQGRYKVDRIAIKEVYGIEIEEPTETNETVLNGKIPVLFYLTAAKSNLRKLEPKLYKTSDFCKLLPKSNLKKLELKII